MQRPSQRSHRTACSCFNPHPPLRAGATFPDVIGFIDRHGKVFQSSPAAEGGCNVRGLPGNTLFDLGFNPHPPLRAGQHRALGVRAGPARNCFNPHPPLRAGATTRQPDTPPRRVPGFNPHPPLRAGATPACMGDMAGEGIEFQSSPAAEGGCNLELGLRCGTRPDGGGFNPHPPLRAGATLGLFDPLPRGDPVSILTRR